ANHAHQYLQFHAAGLSKNDVTVIMPAPPGSGKSTLTAALMNNGWKLFSDEIVLIDLKTGLLQPISRPINLKNNSIDLLSDLYPQSTMTPKFKDTAKGTVALMAPNLSSIKSCHLPQKATHIIYPKYSPDVELTTEKMERSDAFMDLITNSFNYHILQEEGFEASIKICRESECLKLTYSKIPQAIAFFNSLDN
ncbi:MAG: HprK-related kinase A, partial [Motiliproteus sp.]|nr:HprK-related kinase A [Motiliproteus sp.]